MNKNFIINPIRVSDVILSDLQKADSASEKELAYIFFKMFVGNKTIQTFDDTETKNKNLVRLLHFSDVVPESGYKDLLALNERGAGIYLTINETDGTGRKEVNIKKVRSVFVDLDGSPLEPALKYNPTLIVESSSGRFHCYWLSDDIPLTAFSEMQKNIARILNGDPKVHDLPRVLRVPGFYHNKNKPFLSVIRGGLGTIFSYKGLVELFPPEKKPLWSGKKYILDKKTTDFDDFRGQYGASDGNRNNHLVKRAGGMIKRGKPWSYIENELFKEGLNSSPPMSEQEILSVVKSVKRYYKTA